MASSSRYTYEDFLKALGESGFGNGGFSDADMRLAQNNPDAGMSLINYKRDWQNATTDQARALANAGAERVRANYGGYTGGKDGSQFYLTDPSPRDFTYADAPTYNNRYDSQIQDLLGAVLNRPEFSYSAETDPLYAQYRKQYIREGQRASADTMGQAAAMSGGLPSSYAATAAGQAQNYYNAQMTDKIPELEKLAYQKYLDADQLRRSDLAAVQNAEQADYQKYLGQLQQYNTDRSFAYGQYSDELATERQRELDLWDRAQTAAGYGDYKGLNDLGVDTSGYISPQDQWLREMEYQRQRDAVADSRYADELAYERGRDAISDSRYADELAYKRQRDAQADALDRALQAAQFGDYSGLESLGIDTSNYGTGTEPYTSVFDTMNGLGISTYADATTFLLAQGMTLEAARETANNYMSVLEDGRYAQTGGTPDKEEEELHANQSGLIDPGPDASDRLRFAYSFFQDVNSGTDLQTLNDQLDVAVENGWITAAEASSLKQQAQYKREWKTFFSNK